MRNIPTCGLREFIITLAKQQGVAYVKTPMDDLAKTISRLSDAEIDSNEIDNLLVALKRARVITNQDLVMLLGNYLDEKRSMLLSR